MSVFRNLLLNKREPDFYILDYIKGTGIKTDYIDTGVNPSNTDMTKSNITVILSDDTVQNYENYLGANQRMLRERTFNNLMFTVDGTRSKIIPNVLPFDKTIIKWNTYESKITVNNNDFPFDNTSGIAWTGSDDIDLLCGLYSGNPDNGTDAKLHYCKFEIENVKIREFVPIEKNGVVQMYDNINKRFYTNHGSGIFGKGEVIGYGYNGELFLNDGTPYVGI